MPPKPQRALRTPTRYRKTQIAERQREANRLHKALEDTGIKLDSRRQRHLGQVGARDARRARAGSTDPDVLANLAQGKPRPKIPQPREALAGRFESHHRLVIGAILAHIDFLDEHIDSPSEAIEERLGPSGAGVELARTMTGIARRTGELTVAEIGIDRRSPHPGSGSDRTSLATRRRWISDTPDARGTRARSSRR